MFNILCFLVTSSNLVTLESFNINWTSKHTESKLIFDTLMHGCDSVRYPNTWSTLGLCCLLRDTESLKRGKKGNDRERNLELMGTNWTLKTTFIAWNLTLIRLSTVASHRRKLESQKHKWHNIHLQDLTFI